MKILFLGDYSNVHACLAAELRRRGHNVTLVSDGGGFQQTPADILLSRRSGSFGAIKYLMDVMNLMQSLKGYDVVQLINPHFFNLKPGKLAYFFKELKRNNGSFFLTLAGNDSLFVRSACDGETFRFSEFRVGNEPAPLSVANPEREKGYLRNDVARYTEMIYQQIDGAMAILPEYDMAGRQFLGDRCIATNLPINLEQHPLIPWTDGETTKVMIGMKPGMEIQKGTSILLEAAKRVAERSNNRITLERVSGLSYSDYLKKIAECDVLIDQLYAYSPSTNALDAMAMGRVAASGAQPEYYQWINEPDMRPIIPLSPLIDDIEAHLESYLYDRDKLRIMGEQGRKIVERENDVRIVAQRFENGWEKLMK